MPRTLFSPRQFFLFLSGCRAQLRSIRYSDLDGIELNPKSIYQAWDHRGSETKAWTPSLNRLQSSGGGQEYEPLMINNRQKDCMKAEPWQIIILKGGKEKAQTKKSMRKAQSL